MVLVINIIDEISNVEISKDLIKLKSLNIDKGDWKFIRQHFNLNNIFAMNMGIEGVHN